MQANAKATGINIGAMPVLEKFRVLRIFIDVIRNPAALDLEASLTTTLRMGARIPHLKDQTDDMLKRHPEFGALYDSGYDPPDVDLEYLKSLPAGTLGAEYAAFLTTNGLDPKFYPDFPVTDIYTFLATRSQKTHDLMHVVLGLGTSVTDEIALQGFNVAQGMITYPAAIVAVLLLNQLVHDQASIATTFERLARAYRSGREARFFSAFPWENHWADDVGALRARLGIAKVGAA